MGDDKGVVLVGRRRPGPPGRSHRRRRIRCVSYVAGRGEVHLFTDVTREGDRKFAGLNVSKFVVPPGWGT